MMAGRGQQTFKKRQKEQQRKEKQQEKFEKRMMKKHAKDNPGQVTEDEPDRGVEELGDFQSA
jgi:hypothetical protein